MKSKSSPPYKSSKVERDRLLIALGKQIRLLRVAKNWSQEQFAKYCDLDKTYIGGVERGERNITTVNLAHIAKTLGITLKDLFDFPLKL